MYRYQLNIFGDFLDRPSTILIGSGVLIASFLGLYYLSQINYLLFHSLVEGYSTVIAFGIFIFSWNARKYLENGFILFLGIGYLFVGVLGFLHLLSYHGMGVFSVDGPNISTQLWVADRYLESLTILTSFVFVNRRISFFGVFGFFAVLTALLIASIFFWHIFPACYINDIGLTSFKIYSEYTICLILLICLYVIHIDRYKLDPEVHKFIFWSIVLTILAELTFSQYISVYGFLNTLGHLLIIVSFYLIYKAIVFTGIISPLKLIFRDLSEKDIQLKDDLDTIKALEKDRDIILSMLVHDMKTPLISIKGFSSLLLRKSELLINDKSRDYVDAIYRQSEQLEKLVYDFLISSRSGDFKLALNIENCNFHELLEEIVEGFSNRCASAGLEIRLNLPQPSLCASIDKTRFYRAISNLLDNAIRFSPQNGIINVELTVRHDSFRLVIQDQGPGIPDKEIKEVFKPFFRGKGQKDSSGYGLGLAGVKTIVESHGGSVNVSNADSGGAVFSIFMPLESSEPHSSDKTGDTAACDSDLQQKRAARKILVVEDDTTNRMMALAVLGKLGYGAEGAGDGREALQALSKNKYDLVLTDLRMPGMDGFETVKAIRDGNNQVLDRKVPVLALSANANSEERDMALQAGMNGYLTKPIDPQVVAQVLDRWLLDPPPKFVPGA